jgi:hypothetical protein
VDIPKHRAGADPPPQPARAEAEESLSGFAPEGLRPPPTLTIVDLSEWSAGRDPLGDFAAEPSSRPDYSDWWDPSDSEDRSDPVDPEPPIDWIDAALASAAGIGRRGDRFMRELPSLGRQLHRDYWRPIRMRFRQFQVALLGVVFSAVWMLVRAWSRARLRPPRLIRPAEPIRTLRTPRTPQTIRTFRAPRTSRTIRTFRRTQAFRATAAFAGLAIIAVGAVAALNSLGDALARRNRAPAARAEAADDRVASSLPTVPEPVAPVPDPVASKAVSVADDRGTEAAEAIAETTTPIAIAERPLSPRPRPTPTSQSRSRDVLPSAAGPVASSRVAGPSARAVTPSPPPRVPTPATVVPTPVAAPPVAAPAARTASQNSEALAAPRPTAMTGIAPAESPPSVAMAATSAPATAPAPVTTVPAPAAAARVVTPSSAIESVLNRYAFAFSMLDASRAKAVWPSVNERNLERAFDSLESQKFDLGACDISIALPHAVASCDGTAHYTPKVGNRKLRSERRRWTFQLQQRGQDWAIESVDSR